MSISAKQKNVILLIALKIHQFFSPLRLYTVQFPIIFGPIMTLQSPNSFAINITNSSVTKQLFLPHFFFSLPSTILHRENVKGGNSPPQHPAKSCPAHNYHGFDCNYWQQLNLMTEFLKMDKLEIKLEKTTSNADKQQPNRLYNKFV